MLPRSRLSPLALRVAPLQSNALSCVGLGREGLLQSCYVRGTSRRMGCWRAGGRIRRARAGVSSEAGLRGREARATRERRLWWSILGASQQVSRPSPM